jgi:hypothetical protein
MNADGIKNFPHAELVEAPAMLAQASGQYLISDCPAHAGVLSTLKRSQLFN